ncbi:MAG: isochorismatase family protein [Chloroflexi bacterium]|nr:isochorismatase family protein [Chloroflexota bacterium]
MSRAVIVIDMVRGFFEPKYNLYLGPACHRIIPNVRHLLETERKQGSRLLFLCDNHAPDDEEFKMFAPHCVRGTIETEVIPELSPFVEEYIPKTRYSAFYGSKLGGRLAELKPESVVVCGVCTDICVLHTVGDARDRDYPVEVPVDCVTTFDLQAHQFALEHMEKVLGARLTWATEVKPAKPEFRPPIGALFGETVEVGLTRALGIMKGAGFDPPATTEVRAGRAGTLGGMDQVRSFLEKGLSKDKTEVYALEDGEEFRKDEVVLRITAPHQSYMIYETTYLGFLAQSSGWATAARECVRAARGVPVVNLSARNSYPTIVGYMEYASVLGGCKHPATVSGGNLAGLEAAGPLSEKLFLSLGGPERTLAELKKYALAKERVIVPVGVRGEPVEESLFLARGLGGRLHAVKVALVNRGQPLTPETVKEVRASLNAAGFLDVLIFLAGDVTPETIKHFLDNGAPVDYFGVENYIAAAAPVSFEAELCQVGEKALLRPGRLAGPTPNRRLRRVI